MKIVNITYVMVICLFAMLSSSCTKWLEIDPKDKIMENKLFQDREGFLAALNGIYIELNHESIYGGNLSFGFVDVLAQYYTTRGEKAKEHKFKYAADYSFGDPKFESTLEAVWDKAYSLVSNANRVIEQCELRKEMLGEHWYHLIKGETVALRAMLHFDLLRLFGPVYGVEPGMLSIPYRTNSELVIDPLLPAEQVAKLIMDDLLVAEKELEQSDPILGKGIGVGESGIQELDFRKLNMNYYAVKALTARAALYFGQSRKAFDYATQVIKSAGDLFPFISKELINQEQRSDIDRVFGSEILFGLQNVRRSDIFKNYFSTMLKSYNVLQITDDHFKGIYEEKADDFRAKTWWANDPNVDGVKYNCFLKYMEVSVASQYTFPMIKISEMYYIAAECDEHPDEARAKYLNPVLNARGLPDVADGVVIKEAVEKEMVKEFVGEGQLFFQYKRLNKDQIRSGLTYKDFITMTKSNYVFEIPEAESNYRK